MSSNLVPITGSPSGFIDRRQDRQVGRQLDQLDRSKVYGLARLEVQAELQAAKAHAVGYIGQQAMQAVTMVSQMEAQLGAACPLAVTRLQGLADMTALSIAQVVADSARRLS